MLEEQVGAVRHRIAHRAAEQIDHRRTDDLPLQIEHRDFERARHLGGALRAVRSRRQFELDRARPRPDDRPYTLFHALEVEGRQAEHQPAGLVQHAQHRLVAIGLGQADAPVTAFDLDDGTQCPWLVDAGSVQQRAVPERDRRDADVGDPVLAAQDVSSVAALAAFVAGSKAPIRRAVAACA
jgi:hypothetical protein